MKNIVVDKYKILNFIKRNNLTKTDFCKQAKICLTTLNRILNNNQYVNIKSLAKIGVVMNCKVLYELFTKAN